jgi:hypothetical protein
LSHHAFISDPGENDETTIGTGIPRHGTACAGTIRSHLGMNWSANAFLCDHDCSFEHFSLN